MKYGLEDIKKLLSSSKHKYKEDSWFFPNDLIPHSQKLKYACKKLAENGKIERRDDYGRWGYMYRLKTEADKFN